MKIFVKIISDEDTGFKTQEFDVLYRSLYQIGKLKFSQLDFASAKLVLTEFKFALDRNPKKFEKVSTRVQEWFHVLEPMKLHLDHTNEMLDEINKDDKNLPKVPEDFAKKIRALEADRIFQESRQNDEKTRIKEEDTEYRLQLVNQALNLSQTVDNSYDDKFTQRLKEKAKHHLKLGQKSEAVVTFETFYDQFEKVWDFYNATTMIPKDKLNKMNSLFFEWFSCFNDHFQNLIEMKMYAEAVELSERAVERIVFFKEGQKKKKHKYSLEKETVYAHKAAAISFLYQDEYMLSWVNANRLRNYEKIDAINQMLKLDKFNPKDVYNELDYYSAFRNLRVARFRSTPEARSKHYEYSICQYDDFKNTETNKERLILIMFDVGTCFYHMTPKQTQIDALRHTQNCKKALEEFDGDFKIINKGPFDIATSIMFCLCCLAVDDETGTQIPGIQCPKTKQQNYVISIV